MNELIVDVGQTGARWRLDVGGTLANDGVGAPLDGSLEIVGQVAGIVRDALATVTGTTSVSVGVSGLDDANGAADRLLAMLPDADVARVLIAHDSVTSALGAIGAHDGVVLAVGTGIVVTGIGPRAAVRVDGWGSVLDDAGSAYWLGRAGIRAALRDADGRGEPTELTSRAVASFGPLIDIAGSVQRSPARVSDIAGFAPVVTELAGEGDTVSLAICHRAVREWITSATAAARRSGLLGLTGAPVILSWSGTVLTSSALLRDLLRGALPAGFDLQPPLGSPLDGAARLAAVSNDSPLRSLIDDSASNGKPLS